MRPRVRTNALTGYADLARSLGLDHAALLAAVGLDVADLDLADHWIPAAPVARLLQASAEAADCEDLGLRMAALRGLGALGPLGVVLREEPDLGSVLDLLIRYESVYNEALHLRLSRDGETATVLAWLEFGEPVQPDTALDLLMGSLVGIVRALVSPRWGPRSASFSRPAPRDPRPWREAFGSVAFDQRSTGLVLTAADLELPLSASDPSLRPYTRQFLNSTVAGPSFGATTEREQVAEALEALLPLGRMSVDHVARYLGMHPRALQRLLVDQGETFSSVLRATRARLAERYLPNARYSLTELSQLLGFSAPSAFTRWFVQQFGSSPSEWRRRALTRPPSGDGATLTGRDAGSR
jgi:AraC-like DNA-binding protein